MGDDQEMQINRVGRPPKERKARFINLNDALMLTQH